MVHPAKSDARSGVRAPAFAVRGRLTGLEDDVPMAPQLHIFAMKTGM
jgi:hypothetical protein